ncbi:MAG: 30S ribosomal protein S20 [candidate division Zixibacteria bacterium]|nr:30S ribosomal protein S20 [candidate division Zixibacteria bacterium]MBU1471693.1 30S ribosomal protein S20 [candidate division Zixibacteria bacterium]MBU2625411.1 30S ribosomal protein S20 [candidate division Zixibacteria bacterium]
MAHHLHTKKAIRQSDRRRRRNQTTKSKMKTSIKQFLASEAADVKLAALKRAQTAIDRAAKKNIIHKNAAARRKSQLARAYNNLVKSHS